MMPLRQLPGQRNALADAIARDMIRRDERPTACPICLACARAYTKGNGRFCSTRCRGGFDAGLPPYEPTRQRYDLPISGHGFLIECLACRKSFSSCGWRCCSVDCTRKWREDQKLEAELVGDPFRATKRACLECRGPIPNWKNGRRVASARKFCSPRCQKRHARKAGMPADSPDPVLSAESVKKRPKHGAPRPAVGNASIAAEPAG